MQTERHKRINVLRYRNFQKHLVDQISLLCYILIVVRYLKFGGSTILLLIRCAIQSLLAKPFPSGTQLRFLSLRSTRGEIESGGLGIGQTHINVPGGLFMDESSRLSTPEERSTLSNTQIMNFYKKIQKILFFLSYIVNWIIIVFMILFPTDFESLLGKFEYSRGFDLQNTPSPFNNEHSLIQGEWRGSFFMQFVGEKIPESNLKGNFMEISLQFMLLICQFGLFSLTCMNFSPFNEEENVRRGLESQNFDYDEDNRGILLATIKPFEMIDVIFNDQTTN